MRQGCGLKHAHYTVATPTYQMLGGDVESKRICYLPDLKRCYEVCYEELVTMQSAEGI